jgi:phosphatidylinositol kinase/protein kinase (PI-3  family)
MRCFARRETVVQELKDRFRLELTDKECVTYIGDMIKESARNWRTGSYDNYQYYLNGILA